MVTVLKVCLYFVKHQNLMVYGVGMGDEEAFSVLGGGERPALHRISLYTVGT